MLALITTEVAEAIEADRKDLRFDKAYSDEFPKTQCDSDYGFICWYDACCKNTMEEEFADIMLRILDMAWDIRREENRWPESEIKSLPTYCRTFTRTAWHFVKAVLDWGVYDISNSIAFVYFWAEKMDIDLDFHVKAKLRYNRLMLTEYPNSKKKY